MANMISEKARKRVNGAMLSENVGNPVCLLGEFLQMDSTGKHFKLKTSDNQVATVQLQEPIQDYLDGIIEVQGIAAPNDTVQYHSYVSFPKEITRKFDLSLYNETIVMMSLHSAHYKTVS